MTKSFRLEHDVASMLDKTTRDIGVSESSYVSSMLRNRLKVEPLVRNIGGIGLSKDTFKAVLAQTNSAGLEIAAAETAEQNIPLAFEILDLASSVASLRYIIEGILQDWGWFKVEILKNAEDDLELKLFHDFGQRWSLFLKSYLLAGYRLISRRDLQITTTNRMVKIVFQADEA